jgi:membrane-bound lytic murein transglycosylase B
MFKVIPGIFITLTILLVSGQLLAQDGNYAGREDVIAFAKELAESEGFKAEGLLVVFRQAQYKQSIIDAISRPAEKVLTWSEYQDIFLTRSRISAGKKFMLENKEALLRAYQEYGIPPVIITAIIGVETMYGRNRGSYRVLDALSTLAFDYPPRAAFFRAELREFFLLVREENQTIVDVKGSYAGAMGYGQFIPSSYRHYAIDFDDDGIRDIWNNPSDAIGSVANYISKHGWKSGDPIVVRALLDNDAGRKNEADSKSDEVFNRSLKPSSTIGAMKAVGVTPTVDIKDSLKTSPMKLIGKEGDEYWLGLHNFYVITRYNHSKLYAMAIFQLSEALRTSSEIASQSYY